MNNDEKFEYVVRHISHDQISRAIDLLRELLASEPNNANYHGTLAYCLLQQVRIHAAEYELKIALHLEPNNSFFHIIYARIYFLQNKVRQAFQACDMALQLDPEAGDVFELKVEILLNTKQFKEAFFCTNRLAELEPDSLRTKYAYANYYHQTGDNAKAMSFAQAALQQDAQHQASIVLMAHLELIRGRIDEGQELARFAIMLNPNSHDALSLFADVKARKNVFLGLWWRFNTAISKMKPVSQVGTLIFGYIFFNFLGAIAYDFGYYKTSELILYAWLGLVIYSWVGIPLYKRMLAKEIQQFSLKSDY